MVELEENHDCWRNGCPESFTTRIGVKRHVATEHLPLREEVDNYPRAPSER